MATWPIGRQSCYITPAASAFSNALRVERKYKWLPDSQEIKVTTSPLPPWGSPMLCTGRGSHRMATWRATGQSGYIAFAFSRFPKTLRGEGK